jgi:hypothetical protein
MRFVHFSIVPQKLTFDYFEPKDQYFCGLKVSVSLRKGEAVIYQYTKDYAVEVPAGDLERTRKLGIAIEDAFPIIEGQFRMSVLLQNTTGKEFSLFEKEIGNAAPAANPRIDGPFLGYKLEPARSDVQMPFKFADRKLVFDPTNQFSAVDEIHVHWSVLDSTTELWQGGDVQVTVKGKRPAEPVSKISVLKLADGRFGKVMTLDLDLRARDFVPDYYDVQVDLRAPDGTVLDRKTEHFVISPEAAVAHPIIKTKAFPLTNQFVFHYQLAHQYDLLGLDPAAYAAYAAAFALNPKYRDGVIEYVNYLLKVQKFDEALTLSDSLQNSPKGPYDYLLLKGLAFFGKSDYQRAISSLLEANKIYNSDTRLLNALGNCYLRTGQTGEALDAFQASLRMNPAQEDIKIAVKKLQK